jgi:predicted phage terminase large subunit-like protein
MPEDISDIREATLGPFQHFDKEGGHTHDPFPDESFLPPDSGLKIDPDGQYDRQISIKLKGELAKREKCRRDIIAFAERFAPLISGEPYIAGWVHRDIGRRIMKFMRAVEKRERPRLMLLMPPRHGKSLLVSILFFAWVLGHHPEWKLFNVGYNEDLPVEFSKAVRDILTSKAYQLIFPNTRIAQGDRSASDWATSGRGGMRAAGMAGGITGHGAHIMGIDDPLKGAEEADSQAARDKLFAGFVANVRTRIQPGGGVLVIQTWWNDDDLAGRLQRLNEIEDEMSEYRDRYEIVSYPATTEDDEYEYYDNQTDDIIRIRLSEEEDMVEPWTEDELDDLDFTLIRGPCEALHEDRYSYRELMAIKADVTDRVWAALYQQNPVPDSGIFFEKQYTHLVPSLPDPQGGQVCTGWDFAIGKLKRNNYTCGTTIQQIPSATMYVRNVRKFKKKTFGIVDAVVQEALFYMNLPNPPHYVIAVEKGHIWDSISDSIQAAFEANGIPFSIIKEYTASTEKEARAAPMQDKWERGQWRLPEKARWLRNYIAELMKFPNAKDADQVDSSAWACKRLLELGPPRQQEETQVQERDRYNKHGSWRDRLDAMHSSNRSHMSA